MRNLNDDKNKREQILTDGEQKQRFREGLHKFPQNITTGNPAQKRMAIDQSALAKRGRDAARMLGVEHLNESELSDFLFRQQHDFLSAVPERNARGVYAPRTQDERRFVAFNELARLQLAAKDGGKGLSEASVYAPQEEEDAGKALLAELAEKGWPFAGIASRSKTPTEDDAAPQPMPLRAPDPQDVRTPEAPADDTPPRPMPLGTPSPVATPAPTDTPDPTEQQENAEEQEATTGKGSTSASEKEDKLIANLELFLGRKLTTEEMTLLTGPTYKGESITTLPTGEKGNPSENLDSFFQTFFGDKERMPALRGSKRDEQMPPASLNRAQRFERYGYRTVLSDLYKAGEKNGSSSVLVPVTEDTASALDDIRLYMFKEGYDVPYAADYDRVEMTPVNGGYIVRFVNQKNGADAKTLDKNGSWDEYSYTLVPRTPTRSGDVADIFSTLVSIPGILSAILSASKGDVRGIENIISKLYLNEIQTVFDYAENSTLYMNLPRGEEIIHCSSAERLHYTWDAYSGKFIVKPYNATRYTNPQYVAE